jgi:hypothetical protein
MGVGVGNWEVEGKEERKKYKSIYISITYTLYSLPFAFPKPWELLGSWGNLEPVPGVA